MINVSQAFKDAMKDNSKQVNAYINLNNGQDIVTENTGLQSLKITNTGGLCKSVMRQAEAVYFGYHSFLNKFVNLGVGVTLPLVVNLGLVTISIGSPCIITLNSHGLLTGTKIAITTDGNLPIGLNLPYYYVVVIDVNTFNISASYNDAFNNILINSSGNVNGNSTLLSYPLGQTSTSENIDYGKFKVISQFTDQGSGNTTIKMADQMFSALQAYDLSPTFPITMLQLLQLICARLGFNLGTSTFPNNGLIIQAEIFKNQGLIFRDILDQIAEASGSVIYINNLGQLIVRQISSTILETLDQNSLITLKVEPKYGAITSVVLSREPQEDNIVQRSHI